MRLKALTLENFKGIGEAVRVEFAPLTLLFGPNNAGKSTIVQALMYALEVLDRHNCDARKTILGGDAVDLGGFLNIVHGQDRNRVIRMRFELDLTPYPHGNYTPKFRNTAGTYFDPDPWGTREKPRAVPYPEYRNADVDAETAIGGRSTVWVEFRVGWDVDLGGPRVLSYAVGERLDAYATIRREHFEEQDSSARTAATALTLDFSARPFGEQIDDNPEFRDVFRISSGVGRRDNGNPSASSGSAEHFPLTPWERASGDGRKDIVYAAGEIRVRAYQGVEIGSEPLKLFESWVWNILGFVVKSEVHPPTNNSPLRIHTGTFGILPHWNDGLSFPDEVLDGQKDEMVRATFPNFPEGLWGLQRFLSEIIVAPGACLVEELREVVFLSAQRELPERDSHSVNVPGTKAWWNGLAAWDTLLEAEEGYIRRVNEWLNGKGRFESGHEVGVKRYVELDLTDPHVRALKNGATMDSTSLSGLRETVAKSLEQRSLFIRNLGSGARLAPRDVGAGLAQIIPVIVAALRHGGLTAIEEPESKMHPAFQVALADLLIHATKQRGFLSEEGIEWLAAGDPAFAEELKEWRFQPCFLVETHSEHLMLRCLRRIRETGEGEVAEGEPTVGPEDIAVYFYEPSEAGPRIHRIRVDADGEFMDPWPRGFFPERMKEIFGDDL